MLSRFREPFGRAGLIMAVVALVMALVGGAYAANSATDSGKHHHKRKRGPKFVTKPQAIALAKKFAGAEGPPGPQGPAGANGNDGSNGATGEKGANGIQGIQGEPGTPGTPGSDGTDGKSIITETEATGTGNCGGLGGSSFHQEGSGTKTYACNGEPGVLHPGETLPSGATETGAWSAGPSVGVEEIPAAISFAIPLAGELALGANPTSSQVHFIWPSGEEFNEESPGFETPPHCPGSAAEPKADAGNLCIYVGHESGAVFEEGIANSLIRKLNANSLGASESGAVVTPFAEASKATIRGSWAVTGFEPAP